LEKSLSVGGGSFGKVGKSFSGLIFLVVGEGTESGAGTSGLLL
jgi:hypothetical protein